MSLEITFRLRVRDLLDYIDHAFGGVDELGAFLAKHHGPSQSGRILMYEAALRYGDKPNKVVTFSRIYLGETRNAVSAAKLDVLEYLMTHPGASLRELARGLGKNVSTISEHLDELERACLVVKETHGAGRPATLRTVPKEIHIRLGGGPGQATA